MKYLTQNKYWEINKDYNLDKLLYLLIDRSDKYSIFSYIWFEDNNDKPFSRDYDLPAVVWFDDFKTVDWRTNGKPIRVNNKQTRILGKN